MEEQDLELDSQPEDTGGVQGQPQGLQLGRETSTVYVETGRNKSVSVAVGSPFVETITRIAKQANYGDSCRVFLNGEEVINPAEMAGRTIEAGMRIALATYDKPGH